MAVAPKIYVRTQSVKLPGAGTGGDATIDWCASYDPAGGWSNYRVFKVTGFTSGVPNVGAVIDSGDINLTAASAAAFNREEIGYGWPVATTTIKNVISGTPVKNGLYAIQIRQGTGSTNPWSTAETAYFVIRRTPSATDKVLVCYPWSTTVAYSGAWASHVNIYDTPDWQRARAVSRDRPLDTQKLDVTTEFPFLMEQFVRAYDSGSLGVDVCTSFDLFEDANLFDDYNLLISVGHDEYWSKEMSDAVKAFVEGGGNVAFFSANTAWWQARFENSGRTLVCFKSAVEDDETNTSELTGNFCSPPSVEENTLTGVSYRRGTQGYSSTPYTVLASTDPYGYLSGVTGTFGPDGIFDLETDAAEFESRDGTYLATGVDGSPRNFEVLAVCDRRTENIRQRGMATLGYYTNVGTVFTAATTHWAKFLGDTDIATITTNVLDDLRTRHSRATWTLPSRTYPSTTWTSLGTVTGTVPAICGIVLGHTVFQTATTGYATSIDPENPSSGTTSTSVSARSDLVCYGSDLWGTFLYAGTTNGTIYYRDGNVNAADTWNSLGSPPLMSGATQGIGGHDYKFFVSHKTSTDSMLYRVVVTSSATWTILGRTYPPIRSITSFDGKLFGVRDPGTNTTDALDLYCREASLVDLTWTKIGTVPAATFSLAAYYGRLFALAGSSTTNPTLYWRSTIASSGFPYRAPSVLLLNGSSYVVGRVSSNGDFEATGSGTLGFSYTHATRANDGLVFFYNSANGSARVGSFDASGTWTNLKTYASSSFGAWTHVVYVRAGDRLWTDLSPVQEKILFYNSSGTWAYIGYFDPSNGNFVSQWSSSGFSTGWTKIACTHKGDLLFYNGTSGTYAYGRVANNGTFTGVGSGSGFTTGWDAMVPVGNTYLYFYKTTGTGALVDLNSAVTGIASYSSLPTSRNVVGCANGVALAYGTSGAAEVLGFNGDYGSASSKQMMREFPAGALGTSWTLLVPLGIL